MALIFLVTLCSSKDFIYPKFLKLASKLLTLINPRTYAICSVSARELEDQTVVWLILGSPEVTLHRSSQIKAASYLIHLLEYIASP